MAKQKTSILLKYRKEALVLLLGSFIVMLLLFNLRVPNQKREISSTQELGILASIQNETNRAAVKVEEEQEIQSLMLSQFKRNYAQLLQTKKCLDLQNCSFLNSSNSDYNRSVFKDITLRLKTLQPQLASNWFRLNARVKDNVISLIKIESSRVKAEVLDLLISLTVDESKTYLPLVLSEIVDRHDPLLTDMTFEYLKKTSTPENEVIVAKKIARAIAQSRYRASEEVLLGLSKITSPNTAGIFKEALSRLPQSKLKTELLTSAL